MTAKPLATFLILALAFLPGCSRTIAKNDKVEGTVKLGNVPLVGCMVQFIPDIDPKTQAPMSSGLTDEQGKFTLQFDSKEPGAIVGKHHVVVVQGRSGAAGGDREDAGPKKGSAGPAVPAPYRMVTQTPLQVEVKAGEHVYDLVLVANATARPNKQ